MVACGALGEQCRAVEVFWMRISGRLIVSGFMAAFSAVLAQNTPTDASGAGLQAHFDSAQHFQTAGNSDKAAAEYRAFLANAQGELAAEHAVAGDYARAVLLYKDALDLLPDSPALRLGSAKTALLMGDSSRAEALARAFIKDHSEAGLQLAQAHQILGRALLKMNRDQQAKEELLQAVALDASFANRYDLAVVCLDLDDERCAIETFKGMEQSFGDTAAIHMRFGLAYGNSDFVPHAIEEFRKTIAADPRFPSAHYCLAAALLSAGNEAKNLPEAEEELKKELAISPNDYLTYSALGKLAVASHHYSEAARYLKRAISLKASNPDAFLHLGEMYYDIGRAADAEAALRKAIELTRDPSRNRYQIQRAHFLLGRILMGQHNPEAARAEMQISRTYANKVLSQDKSELAGLLHNSSGPGAADVSSGSGFATIAVQQDSDPAAMRSVMAHEKHLAPAIADSYNNLGAIAAAGHNYSEALGYFEDASAWNPHLEGLDLNRGRAAFMASRFSEAIPPLTRYVRAHAGDSGTRGALAMSQFMVGDYKGCIDTFKTVEEKLSSIPQMEYVFAESLVETGQVASGKTRLEALERAHPEIADVHRALGEVFAAEEDRRSAAKELNTAISLNVSDSKAHYDLGKVEVESGQSAAAIPELEAATLLAPKDPTYHKELATAYSLASRQEEARIQFAIYEGLKGQQSPAVLSLSPRPTTNTSQLAH
jgi:tetratricopeptide (TPR) repeat protein